jgi:hypothetical protein
MSEFYYGKITLGQYQRIFNNLINFNPRDYKTIKSLVPDGYRMIYRLNNIHLIQDDELGFTNQAYQITIIDDSESDDGYSYIISKKKDDYYIVEKCETEALYIANRGGEYYYCDQIDGLSKFLMKEFGIKVIKEKYDISKIETISEIFEMYFNFKRVDDEEFNNNDDGVYKIFITESTGIGDYVAKIVMKKLSDNTDDFYKKIKLFSNRIRSFYDVIYINLREYEKLYRTVESNGDLISIEIFYKNDIVKESNDVEKWFHNIKDLIETHFNFNLNKVGILTAISDMSENDYKFIPKRLETEIIICGNLPVESFISRLRKFGYNVNYESNITTSSSKLKFTKIRVANPKYLTKIGNRNIFNEFFNESKEDILYIFDFDDTLVLNPSFDKLAIEYLKEDISIKSLLQSSLRKISKSIEDLKWENGRIFIEDPNSTIDVKGNWVRRGKRVYLTAPDKFYYTDMSLPIKTTELSNLYNSVENKAIVTGRPLDIKDKVENSLKEFNLDDPNYGLHCYPAKRGTSERVADWKAKTIINLIKDSKFKKVYFYDDNSKWVNKVTKEVKKELPDIDWNPIKYKHKHG